nr:MAG TPA: hypothetical protein [Caudoviricetes sp.]
MKRYASSYLGLRRGSRRSRTKPADTTLSPWFRALIITPPISAIRMYISTGVNTLRQPLI